VTVPTSILRDGGLGFVPPLPEKRRLARGGYAVFPVGSAGAQEALARSVEGTLFFAGEATAGGHAGTVDGALRSGERAAREVAASLRRYPSGARSRR